MPFCKAQRFQALATKTPRWTSHPSTLAYTPPVAGSWESGEKSSLSIGFQPEGEEGRRRRERGLFAGSSDPELDRQAPDLEPRREVAAVIALRGRPNGGGVAVMAASRPFSIGIRDVPDCQSLPASCHRGRPGNCPSGQTCAPTRCGAGFSHVLPSLPHTSTARLCPRRAQVYIPARSIR